MRRRLNTYVWIASGACAIAVGWWLAYIWGYMSKNFTEVFAEIFGTVSFNRNGKWMQTLLIWILPQIVVLGFMGNAFEKIFFSARIMLITRTQKIFKYIISIIGEIELNVLWICVLEVGTFYITCAVMLKKLPQINYRLIGYICIFIMYQIFLVLFINALSLMTRASVAFLITMIGEIVTVGLVRQIYISDNQKIEILQYFVPGLFGICPANGKNIIILLCELIALSGLVIFEMYLYLKNSEVL